MVTAYLLRSFVRCARSCLTALKMAIHFASCHPLQHKESPRTVRLTWDFWSGPSTYTHTQRHKNRTNSFTHSLYCTPIYCTFICMQIIDLEYNKSGHHFTSYTLLNNLIMYMYEQRSLTLQYVFTFKKAPAALMFISQLHRGRRASVLMEALRCLAVCPAHHQMLSMPFSAVNPTPQRVPDLGGF